MRLAWVAIMLAAACAGPSRQARRERAAAPPPAAASAVAPAGGAKDSADEEKGTAASSGGAPGAADPSAAARGAERDGAARGAPGQEAAGRDEATGRADAVAAEARSGPAGPEAVRSAVSAAATGIDGDGWRRAARALESVAGLLGRLDSEGSAAAPIAQAREEARALAGLGPVDLDRADRLRAGLAAGVDAIGSIARSRGERSLDPWIAAAARAVGAIDAAAPLGLQRAVVQDALRSVADAVLVAWQLQAG